MDHDEKKLSDYIDCLNAEQKPEAHADPSGSPELGALFDTVRLVRSLREPAMPEAGYPEKLARAVKGRTAQKKPEKSRKRVWMAGTAAAAVLIMALMLNFLLPLGRTDIVYAMEEAFQGVRAYHGFLEIVQANAKGEETLQARLEVWADKAGRYYIKELEGSQKDLVTVNNGQKKWQVRPGQKQVHIFPAFPDASRFTFELGSEIEEVKNALSTRVAGEDTVAGRPATILEVSPQGGVPYRIWIDKESKLPLQKQYGMQNALQYKLTYAEIDYADVIPAELTAYAVPAGFAEIDTKPEQLVNDMDEAQKAAGFMPKVPENIPEGYGLSRIAVETDTKSVKLEYIAGDKGKRIIVLQGKSAGEFRPASTAVLGKVGDSAAEIQSPIRESLGILGGGGPYAGVTDLSAIRWREAGYEYAVVGNASLEELVSVVESLAGKTVETPFQTEQVSNSPQVEVSVDLEIEENEQKSSDAGHSPWKLDPAFTAQVFVSLKLSPEGITGEYPIDAEDLKIIRNTGKTAVVEVSGGKTPIRRVYLKRLIRQDATGIWTVTGYDPADKK